MSVTEDSHWREPPSERVNPDYPVHLTKRYGSMQVNDSLIIYDEMKTGDRWIQGEGIEREAMV